jgi:hypothetical protein
MDDITIPEATGAFSSRKFVLTCVALGLVTGVSILGCWFTGLAAVLPTFIGGMLGILSLYFTGNVMNKYIVGKTLQTLTGTTETVEEVSTEGAKKTDEEARED